MRLLLRGVFFILFLLSVSIGALAQSITNMGTEFYTVFADHIYPSVNAPNGNPSQMFLYITSDKAANGIVEITNGPIIQTFTLSPNQIKQIPIPAAMYLGNLSGTISGKSIHIRADANISVYAHIYAGSVSGATMLLPVNTLGKDYQSVNFTQRSNSTDFNEGKSYSFFTIVATDDNTAVQITAKTAIYKADLINVNPANVPFTITLNKGDVYQGLSDNDLTSTHIQSVSLNGQPCKPLAVFSGSTKIYIGSSISSCNTIQKTSDNLFQQAYPTATWGTQFVTVPLKGRESSTDIYRVIVKDPTTNITGVPAFQQSDLVNKGFIEFSAGMPMVISADKPIQVVQYALTQYSIGCDPRTGDVGDPEMIYLNPVGQGVSQTTFYATGRNAVTSSYVNVVMPTDAAASFRIDGNIVNFTCIDDVYSYAQIPVTSGDQSATLIPTNNGIHSMTASKPFNAIVYGFGNIESYGYSAGTSFAVLNGFINLVNPLTQSNVQNSDCSNTSFNPQLTLPYQVGQIIWKFDNGTSYIQNAPAVTTSLNGNQTVYTYQYFNADKNTSLVYFTGGTHTLIANINDPSGQCAEDVALKFSLLESPTVTLTAPASICQNADAVVISENKNGFTGTGIFTGDGISADGIFNPAVAGLGTHTINYNFVANPTGCTYTQTFNISVIPVPIVSTGADLKILEGETATLTATATGSGLSYKWYPATGLNRDDILNPVAKPLNDTKYTLTVTSANGCTNFAQISVVVLKLPKPTNTFTPNGDGVNDYWYIDQLAKYTNATVNVYTRSGEKVFSSIGYSLPWDGKYNGNDLPVGVYYYIVDLKSGKKVMSGYVTIIR